MCMHGVGAACSAVAVSSAGVHARRGCCMHGALCACMVWVVHYSAGAVSGAGVHARCGCCMQCRCSERCRCACMACVLHAWGFVCMHGVGAACSAGAVSGAGVHARCGCCEHTCMCCRAAAHTEGWGEGMQTAVLFLQQVAAAARCPCASLAARLTRCAIWGGRRGVLRCCRCCRAWGAVPRLCSSAAMRLSEGLGAQRRKCSVRLQDLGAGLR